MLIKMIQNETKRSFAVLDYENFYQQNMRTKTVLLNESRSVGYDDDPNGVVIYGDSVF